MPNLGDLKQRIATDIARSNLGPRISEAVAGAVRYFGHELFPHNWQTLEITLVPGSFGYAIPGDGRVLAMQYAQLDANLRTTLRIRDAAWMAGRYDANLIGDPLFVALRGNDVFFHPIPHRELVVTVRLNISPPLPSDDGGENFWTNEAFDLIRHKAKHDLFTNLMRGPAAGEGQLAMQQAMMERDNLQRVATFNTVPHRAVRTGWV